MSTAIAPQRVNQPAPRPSAPPPGPAASGSVALDPFRVLRQYYPWLTLSGIVGCAMGVGLYIVLLLLVPQYTASATFQMYPAIENAADPVNQTQGGAGGGELDRYMQTQVLVMKSDFVLKKALDERNIKEKTKWIEQFKVNGIIDPQESLKKLRKIVSARVIPETSVVRLAVTTGRADDAQIIAKAIQEVYLSDVNNDTTRDTQKLREQFERKVKELKTDVAALDAQMENMVSNESLPAVNQKDTALYAKAVALQTQLVSIREELSRARDQLKQYEEMKNSPGGTQYPEAVRQAAEQRGVVQQMDAQIAFATAELVGLKREYGDNHPSVVRSQNRIDALLEERRTRLEKEMADTFSAAIEGLRNGVGNFEASEKDLIAQGEEVNKKLTEITSLLKRYSDLEVDRGQKMEQIKTFESEASNLSLIIDRGGRARKLQDVEKPDQVSFPLLIPTVALSMLLMLGLAGGVIVLKELREQRIRSPQDVALIPRTRVLGIVPEIGMDPTNPQRIETASLDRPDGAIAESIRQIRTGILKTCHEKQYKTLLVASGMPGSGGTSIVCNLAVNAAAIDLNVLVIDANVRRPAIHSIFGVQAGPGLAEALAGTCSLEAAVQQSSVAGLHIMPAGTDRGRAYERFTTTAMNDLVQKAREKYDLVIIDAPPAVVSGDALALAGKCDAAVLVVRAYSEKRGLLARLRHQFDDVRAEFLGVVVNAVRPSAGGYFKGNFLASSRYLSAADEPASKAAAAAPEAPESTES